jgi:hypothetical protein
VFVGQSPSAMYLIFEPCGSCGRRSANWSPEKRSSVVANGTINLPETVRRHHLRSRRTKWGHFNFPTDSAAASRLLPSASPRLFITFGPALRRVDIWHRDVHADGCVPDKGYLGVHKCPLPRSKPSNKQQLSLKLHSF